MAARKTKKASTSQIKKKAPAKPKAKATKRPLKVVKAAPKSSVKPTATSAAKKTAKALKNQAPQGEHTHLFWKLLEQKKQARKEHEEKPQPHGHGDQKSIEHRHQAKYARFAGPRRRAA